MKKEEKENVENDRKTLKTKGYYGKVEWILKRYVMNSIVSNERESVSERERM